MSSASELIRRFREEPPSSASERKGSAAEVWWANSTSAASKGADREEVPRTSRTFSPARKPARSTEYTSSSVKQSSQLGFLGTLSLDLDALIESEIQELESRAKSRRNQPSSPKKPPSKAYKPIDGYEDDELGYRHSLDASQGTLGSTGLVGLYRTDMKLDLRSHTQHRSEGDKKERSSEPAAETYMSLSEFIQTLDGRPTVKEGEGEGDPQQTMARIVQQLTFDMQTLTAEQTSAEEEEKRVEEEGRVRDRAMVAQGRSEERARLLRQLDVLGDDSSLRLGALGVGAPPNVVEEPEVGVAVVLDQLKALSTATLARAQRLSLVHATAVDPRLDPVEVAAHMSGYLSLGGVQGQREVEVESWNVTPRHEELSAASQYIQASLSVALGALVLRLPDPEAVAEVEERTGTPIAPTAPIAPIAPIVSTAAPTISIAPPSRVHARLSSLDAVLGGDLDETGALLYARGAINYRGYPLERSMEDTDVPRDMPITPNVPNAYTPNVPNGYTPNVPNAYTPITAHFPLSARARRQALSDRPRTLVVSESRAPTPHVPHVSALRQRPADGPPRQATTSMPALTGDTDRKAYLLHMQSVRASLRL